MTDHAATFTVEYPCARHCRAEVDLTDAGPRFTLRQMLQAADDGHERAHRAAAGEYQDGRVTVWSVEMAGVSKS